MSATNKRPHRAHIAKPFKSSIPCPLFVDPVDREMNRSGLFAREFLRSIVCRTLHAVMVSWRWPGAKSLSTNFDSIVCDPVCGLLSCGALHKHSCSIHVWTLRLRPLAHCSRALFLKVVRGFFPVSVRLQYFSLPFKVIRIQWTLTHVPVSDFGIVDEIGMGVGNLREMDEEICLRSAAGMIARFVCIIDGPGTCVGSSASIRSSPSSCSSSRIVCGMCRWWNSVVYENWSKLV